MMENGAEGYQVIGFMGDFEKLFDGFVNERRGIALNPGFFLQQIQHFLRNVHHRHSPAAFAHFQRKVAGASTALETKGRAPQ